MRQDKTRKTPDPPTPAKDVLHLGVKDLGGIPGLLDGKSAVVTDFDGVAVPPYSDAGPDDGPVTVEFADFVIASTRKCGRKPTVVTGRGPELAGKTETSLGGLAAAVDVIYYPLAVWNLGTYVGWKASEIGKVWSSFASSGVTTLFVVDDRRDVLDVVSDLLPDAVTCLYVGRPWASGGVSA